MKTETNPVVDIIKTLLVIGLLVVVVMNYIMVSNHALTAHNGERWSAERVLDTVTAEANNPGRGVCRPLVIAYCPNAINRAAASPFYGEVSPQVRVYCGLNADGGIMAVFGVRPRVYITGYYVMRSRFDKIIALDSCVMQDLSWFQNFLTGW